jgi:hypothetical protein
LGHFVDRHRLEHVILHAQPLHRIRELDGHPQPGAERVVQAGNAGAATDRVDPRQAASRARCRREECRGALDTDRDFFTARGDIPGEVGMLRRALNDLLGFVGRDALFALEIFAETPGADGEITRQHGDAVLEDIHVGDFVTDVDEPDDPFHGVGMIQLERIVDGEGVDVDNGRIETGLA